MNGPALAMSFASLGSEAARAAVASAGSYGTLRVGPERGLGMLRVCHACRCRAVGSMNSMTLARRSRRRVCDSAGLMSRHRRLISHDAISAELVKDYEDACSGMESLGLKGAWCFRNACLCF